MSDTTTSNSAGATHSAGRSEGRSGGGTGDQDEPGSSPSSADADVPPEPEPADAEHGAPSNIEITIDGDAALTSRVKAHWVRDRLIEAAAHVNRPVTRIGLQFTDDAHMAALHQEHADQPGTTDVLTFELSERGEPIDVDIAVCVDVADRRAAEREHSIERELLLYALHGLLHCAGYDDHDPDQFDVMHDEEDRILAAIGVGATFRVAADRTGGGLK